MRNRMQDIKSKGFNISAQEEQPVQNYVDFGRIKMGAKVLDDAILNIGVLKKVDSTYANKENVLTALANRDYAMLREISNFFYETSGIYSRLCTYLSTLYRYDWMVTPYVNGGATNAKILTDFDKVLTYLDNFGAKQKFGDIALKILKNGCYYAYGVDQGDMYVFQELPVKYCRSRFSVNDRPVVEFNMRFFDEMFSDIQQRTRMLSVFPKEFSKGYVLYKEGKLPAQFRGDTTGWYMLDPEASFKFNIGGSDYPVLVNIVPNIIDLDEAQEMDKKKTMQQLLKILIQKMPFDKNGELIFDVDEARDLHNNAVNMLSEKAIGVDILTTFADIEMVDLADKNSATSKDDLLKVERGVFNQAGISQGLFNTDGNLALDKSVAKDEAFMVGLVYQYQGAMNHIIKKFNKGKKVNYKVELLLTTVFNYKELSKLYKEQATLGYSKFLPQIALGVSQSAILASAYFENEVLNLTELLVPAQSSNTQSSSGNSQKTTSTNNESNTAGRKELADDQKSTKTIQNKESMN